VTGVQTCALPISITGYINDERLHAGNAIFNISRTRDGFVTSQEGERHNEVVYRRTR
jgi:hypothetical protein